MLEEINTANAPGAVGPFSQTIKVGNLLDTVPSDSLGRALLRLSAFASSSVQAE